MQNLNFEDYFNSLNDEYYDSKIIITILENILDKKIEDIKSDINSMSIIVTDEQIKEFLNKRFKEENSEIKERIENPIPRPNKSILEMEESDIESLAQDFFDYLIAGRYHFEPYALKYFNKYVTILKNKLFILLNIIEKIGNKESLVIKDILDDIDIQIDSNGSISREDIIRLIVPTVYNINELIEKVEQANDLSTYLTFKMSKHRLLKNDLSEDEIYPSESIQIKSLYYNHIKGNVPLSNNQKDKLKQQLRKCMKITAQALLDWN